jgi:hypothetical protein
LWVSPPPININLKQYILSIKTQ